MGMGIRGSSRRRTTVASDPDSTQAASGWSRSRVSGYGGLAVWGAATYDTVTYTRGRKTNTGKNAAA